MARPTKRYILEDLTWLEEKLKSMKQFIEAIPVDKLTDRTTIAMSAKGTPVIKLVASIEQQLTARLKLSKEILQMLAEIDKLREEKQIQEMEVRGGGEINLLMKRKLENQ